MSNELDNLLPDVGRMRALPELAPYLDDSGFTRALDELEASDTTPQRAAQLALDDPRLMQAVAALHGQRLDVDEADVARAEASGAIPRRDAVQRPHRERARAHASAADARAAANGHYARAAYADAVACYERAVGLVERDDECADAAPALGVLHANIAAAMLKLRRPREALRSCEGALAHPGAALQLGRARIAIG